MSTRNLIKGFKRPSKIEFVHDEVNENFGRFIAEPFEKGYGTTVGNCLRRVLLSSIEGAAITAVKIEGISHEFSTIEGVYEDVTRIILNLKKLRFKYEEDLPKVIHISKSGAGQLTGADFEVDSDIFVMNKNWVIANLDEKANLEMDIQIERGRGYLPADSTLENTEVIGVIPIDAIFSPISRVNIKVMDTRVGQRTDFDKLILEIWTDGSIKPDDALAQAAKIIKDHMTIFINFEEEVESETTAVDENREKLREVLTQSIDDLKLSVRAYNTLKILEVNSVDQLVRKTEDEIKKSKHNTDMVFKELKARLEALNLSLGIKD